jgi:uncharacterized membrane protein YciS (DUF1049 family)
MSTEERDLIEKNYRVSATMLRSFILGTIAVCSTIIGGVVYIKNNLTLHEYKIGQIDRVNDKQDMMDEKILDKISMNTTEIYILKAKK